MKSEDHYENGGFIALGGVDRVVEITSSILIQNGIEKTLFSKYEIEKLRWLERIQTHGLSFSYNSEKSIAANLEELYEQAEVVQKSSGKKAILGAFLLHLVGAYLETILGEGLVKHTRYSGSADSAERHACFVVDNIAIHVTTRPSEALAAKAHENIADGLKPIVVTSSSGIQCADFLLTTSILRDQIDVLDAIQLLSASIYQGSCFRAGECEAILRRILDRYNKIVGKVENEPLLKIHF